ncbi:MAG TPA: hypothetical protein VFA11_17535 [Acidimicrobiales bacterium]|nr:hypothetical protein [Acidimicrobiales bacterium]
MSATAATDLVGIDVLDAVELSEICCYVADWVRAAPGSVRASLVRHGASADAPAILLESLDRFAEDLLRLPGARPRAEAPEPLSGAEAAELAELLLYVAYRGWPEDPHRAACLVADCRGWAARLARIAKGAP